MALLDDILKWIETVPTFRFTRTAEQEAPHHFRRLDLAQNNIPQC